VQTGRSIGCSLSTPRRALPREDQTARTTAPATRCNDVARIGQLRRLTRFGSFVTTPGGFMGKREPQIILKTDERKIVLELTGQIRRQINRTGREPGLPRGR
jgi:hypothetical protein